MDDKAFREIREIEVELTGACTRSCAFCAPGLPERRRSEPKYLCAGRVQALAKELAKIGYNEWVTLCGWGEPTLAPDLWIVLGLLGDLRKKTGAKIRVFTNGDGAAFFRDMRPDRGACRWAFPDDLVVSVYEPPPEWLKCYSLEAGTKVRKKGKEENSPIRIQDHRGRSPNSYSSRAGNVKPYPPEYEARLAKRRHTPCEWFRAQLFLTAEGNWVTCCNDMAQVNRWEGGFAILFSNPEYLAMRRALADPKIDRRTLRPCSQCESPLCLGGDREAR